MRTTTYLFTFFIFITSVLAAQNPSQKTVNRRARMGRRKPGYGLMSTQDPSEDTASERLGKREAGYGLMGTQEASIEAGVASERERMGKREPGYYGLTSNKIVNDEDPEELKW